MSKLQDMTVNLFTSAAHCPPATAIQIGAGGAKTGHFLIRLFNKKKKMSEQSELLLLLPQSSDIFINFDEFSLI